MKVVFDESGFLMKVVFTEMKPCRTHPDCPSFTTCCCTSLISWRYTEETLIFWVKGLLVEQNRTPSIMDHKEAIRQVVVVKVFKRFLQSDDVPFHHNVLFDGYFFSTPGSWVPVVDTAPRLIGQAIGHVGIEGW